MHTMFFNHSHSFQLHPDALHAPFHLFLVHWCRVIHWSRRSLPGALPSKKNDSPTRVAIDCLSTRVGPVSPTPSMLDCWLGWSHICLLWTTTAVSELRRATAPACSEDFVLLLFSPGYVGSFIPTPCLCHIRYSLLQVLGQACLNFNSLSSSPSLLCSPMSV